MLSTLLVLPVLAQGIPAPSPSESALGTPLRRSAVRRFAHAHAALPAADALTHDVLLADLDGDGDSDAFLANSGPNVLLLNDGTGLFRDAGPKLPSFPGTSAGAAALDVEGDGDLDLVTAERSTGDLQNRLLLNGGDATFVDGTDLLPSDADRSTAVAQGDLDGDGDPDLWFGNGSFTIGATDRVLRNDGGAGFTTLDPPGPSTMTTAVALGDVDGDGDLDALVGTDQREPAVLYLNDGAAGFESADFPPGDETTEDVALGDVDGDGDLDAVLANWLSEEPAGQKNELYANDGAGGFAAVPFALPTVEDATRSVVVGDVDGDGELDLWFGNDRREAISQPFGVPYTILGASNRWLTGDGGVFHENARGTVPALDSTQAGALADVDGDGDADLLAANDGLDRLELGDGAGTFADAGGRPLPLETAATHAVAFADVDGDGALDAFLGRGHPDDEDQPNALLFGDGTGLFEEDPRALPSSPRRAHGAAFGDVDGDEDLDLFLVNPYDGEFFPLTQDHHLYLGDGQGSFTDATAQLPVFVGDHRGLGTIALLEDVDADGDLDALVGSYNDFDGGGAGVDLWTNDGRGLFTDASDQVTYPGSDVEALVAGDVDGNGSPDLVVGSAPVWIYLLQNDGGGVFSDAGDQLPPLTELGTTPFLELLDADSDGDLDVAAGRLEFDVGPRVLLWVNDGRGSFSEASQRVPQVLHRYEAGDVEGDGDPDLVAPEALLANDGKGTFHLDPFGLPLDPGGVSFVELADVDGDGDLDGWLARTGVDLLWSNTDRHLAWRGLPRVGQPLRLEVYGPALDPWWLAASPSPAEPPLPTPLGLLRLDPRALFGVTGGELDARGKAGWAAAVPALPALVGTELFWQAAVGSPPALTNLERTVLSAF